MLVNISSKSALRNSKKLSCKNRFSNFQRFSDFFIALIASASNEEWSKIPWFLNVFLTFHVYEFRHI